MDVTRTNAPKLAAPDVVPEAVKDTITSQVSKAAEDGLSLGQKVFLLAIILAVVVVFLRTRKSQSGAAASGKSKSLV